MAALNVYISLLGSYTSIIGKSDICPHALIRMFPLFLYTHGYFHF